jgi:hypothetical protein
MPHRSGTRLCAQQMLAALGTSRRKTILVKTPTGGNWRLLPQIQTLVHASADESAGNPTKLYRTADGGVTRNPVQIDGSTDQFGYRG